VPGQACGKVVSATAGQGIHPEVPVLRLRGYYLRMPGHGPDLAGEPAGVWGTLRNVLLLRCPRCGSRPVFSGMFRMFASCRGCRPTFERESGYFVGSIYVNYGFTAALLIGGDFALERLTTLGPGGILGSCAAAGVVLPILFFRPARVLWLGIDILLDPPA